MSAPPLTPPPLTAAPGISRVRLGAERTANPPPSHSSDTTKKPRRARFASALRARTGSRPVKWCTKALSVIHGDHAESGNDLPVFLSTANAEKVDGGYKITGHKFFGSLSPIWTRFGFHAMDTSNPEAPRRRAFPTRQHSSGITTSAEHSFIRNSRSATSTCASSSTLWRAC